MAPILLSLSVRVEHVPQRILLFLQALGHLASKSSCKILGFIQDARPLLSVEQVPSDMRKIGVLHGYRPVENTAIQCLLSIFTMNTETLNFWTHFLPTWYFAWLFNDITSREDMFSDSYFWPFLAFFGIIFTYLLASSFAHLFSGLSRTAHDICFFYDYVAVCLYAYGTVVIYRTYSLPDDWLRLGYGDFLMKIGFVWILGCMTMSCCTRLLDPTFSVLLFRTALFSGTYIAGGIPIWYRLLTSSWEIPSLQYHFCQCILAVIGAIVYGFHVPEKLAPGKFNCVGHSHQLMHIISVLASHFQLKAVFNDLIFRKETILVNNLAPTILWSCVSPIVLVLCCLSFLYFFIPIYLKKKFNGTSELFKSN